MGDILILLKDGTHGTHHDTDSGPLLLSAKNIKNGTVQWDESDRRISKDEYENIHANFKLKDGDVLLTIVGSIGETAILKHSENVTFQRSVAFLRPSNELKSEFLYSEIQSSRFQKELNNRKSTSAQPGIYLGDLGEISIDFPKNEDEQYAVSQYFCNLDSLITLHQRQHFLHSTPDISLSVRLIHPFYTSSWEQRKFEEIAVRSSVICSDDTLPRVEYEDIVSGTGRLNKDIYAKQSIKSGIAFHQGDVLYGKLRPYLQNWLLPTFDGLAVGDFWVLQPQNADSSFLYRLIQSRQFDEVANQSTGTKMPRADWKLVSKTVFSIPSNISEQAAIGTYFTALDSLITLHQRKGKAAVSGCSNDANNSKGVCCKARDFGYKCHKKDEPNRFDA